MAFPNYFFIKPRLVCMQRIKNIGFFAKGYNFSKAVVEKVSCLREDNLNA